MAMRTLYVQGLLFGAGLAFLCACATEMWIPVDTTPRSPVILDQVAYLLDPPDKPYTVVGIITPPPGEYETEAEAVKAMRREAAAHGADAVFIESRTVSEGWQFSTSPWGASGGESSEIVFRAMAIVWK